DRTEEEDVRDDPHGDQREADDSEGAHQWRLPPQFYQTTASRYDRRMTQTREPRGSHAVHETASSRSRPALVATLVLTGGFMVVEAVAGLWTGSLALLADAAHMLTD